MAIYKPTDMQPAFTGFDIRDINANKSIWLSCKIDTNNTNVTAYSIELYDEENNLLFPFNETGKTAQEKLKNKISMVEDLYAICQRYDEYKTYISQYGKNVNTGINGSYLVIPFFVNELDISAGTVSRNQIDLNNIKSSEISNNKKFKWNITLYQGVERQGNEIILPNNAPPNDKYFDMVVTNGLVVGSTINRIQTMFNDDLLTYTDELFIQPTYMTYNNGTPVDSNDVNGWLSTSFSNVAFQNIGHRELIESYDSFLAHIYPDKDKLSLNGNGKQANTYHLYKVGDNPENLTEYQKAGYFIDCCVPWVWKDTVADPSQAYGTQTYITTLDPKENGYYPFSEEAIPSGSVRSGTSDMSVYRNIHFASEQSRERCILNYQINATDETSGSGAYLVSNHNGLFYPTFVPKEINATESVTAWSPSKYYPKDFYVYRMEDISGETVKVYYISSQSAFGNTQSPDYSLYWRKIPNFIPYDMWNKNKDYEVGTVVSLAGTTQILFFTAVAASGPNTPNGVKYPVDPTGNYWSISYFEQCKFWNNHTFYTRGDYVWMINQNGDGYEYYQSIDRNNMINPQNSPYKDMYWRKVPLDDLKNKIYNILVTWHRADDADMWGKLDKKIIYVEKNSPYKAGQNVQITYTAPSQGFPSINETKLRFINEQPLEVFALPDGITSSNNYSKNTGLIFYDREKTEEGSWTKIKDAMVYIRPSTEILPNMRWIKKTDENLFFDIDYIDSDYWNLRTSKSGFPKVNPDTPYVIKSYFRRSDTVPFDAVQDPEIVITPSDNTVITQPKFTASAIYDQDRLRQWRSFQWQLFQNNELLSESDVYYDGIINHDFYVVDNSPEFGVSTRTFYINKDVPAEDVINGFTINDIVGFEEIEIDDCVLSANGNVYRYLGRSYGFVIELEYLYSLPSDKLYNGKICYCTESFVMSPIIACHDGNIIVPTNYSLGIGSFICGKNGIVFKAENHSPQIYTHSGPYKYTLTENNAVNGYHYCYYYPDVIDDDTQIINKNNIIIPSDKNTLDIKIEDMIYTVNGKLFRISNINNNDVSLNYMFLIDINSDGNTNKFNDNYLFYYDGILSNQNKIINRNNIIIPNSYNLHQNDFICDETGNIFIINDEINDKIENIDVSFFYNCFNNYILRLIMETEYGLKKIIESKLRINIDYKKLVNSLEIISESDCATHSAKISLGMTSDPENKIYQAKYLYSLIGNSSNGHYCNSSIFNETTSIPLSQIVDSKSIKVGDLLIGPNAGVAKVVLTGNTLKVEYLYNYSNLIENLGYDFDSSINNVKFYNGIFANQENIEIQDNNLIKEVKINDILCDKENSLYIVDGLNSQVFYYDYSAELSQQHFSYVNVGHNNMRVGDLIVTKNNLVFKISNVGTDGRACDASYIYDFNGFSTIKETSVYGINYPISGNNTMSIPKSLLSLPITYSVDVEIEYNPGSISYLSFDYFTEPPVVGGLVVGKNNVAGKITDISIVGVQISTGDYYTIKENDLLLSYEEDSTDNTINNVYGVFRIKQIMDEEIKIEFLYDARCPNINNVYGCDFDISGTKDFLYGAIKNDNNIRVNDYLFNYKNGDVSLIISENSTFYTSEYKYNIKNATTDGEAGGVFGYSIDNEIEHTNVGYVESPIAESTSEIPGPIIIGSHQINDLIVDKKGAVVKIINIISSSVGIEHIDNLHNLLIDFSEDNKIYYANEEIVGTSEQGITIAWNSVHHNEPLVKGDLIIGKNGGILKYLGPPDPAMSFGCHYINNLFNLINTESIFIDGMLTISDDDIISITKPHRMSPDAARYTNQFAIQQKTDIVNGFGYTTLDITSGTPGIFSKDIFGPKDINSFIISSKGDLAKIIGTDSGGEAKLIEYVGNLYSMMPDLSLEQQICYVNEDIIDSTNKINKSDAKYSGEKIHKNDIVFGKNGGFGIFKTDSIPLTEIVYIENNDNILNLIELNETYYSVSFIAYVDSSGDDIELVHLYDIKETSRNTVDYLLYITYLSSISGSNKNQHSYYVNKNLPLSSTDSINYESSWQIGDVLIGNNGGVARIIGKNSGSDVDTAVISYLYNIIKDNESIYYYGQDIDSNIKYIYGRELLDISATINSQDLIVSVNGGIANAIKQVIPDITNVLLIKREVWRKGPLESNNLLAVLSPINEGVVNVLDGSKNLLSSFDYFDYNVGNKRTYEYSLLIQIGASSQWYLYKTPIEIIWDDWSITELHPTGEDNVFTASDKDVWKFKFNISPGEISQNFIKNQQDTLGLFPKIFHGPKKALSGSVSCLMGRDILPYAYSSERFEYEVNNVTLKGSWNRVAVGARGIGGYTEVLKDKISRANSSDMLNAWREVCYSTNPKLLKDAKGNIYIVEIIDGSSQVNEAWSSQQPETISFSWIQIADGTNYQIYSKKGRV